MWLDYGILKVHVFSMCYNLTLLTLPAKKKNKNCSICVHGWLADVKHVF